MYEHPIKRAGLTFNRILFSNTKMVAKCMPIPQERFKVSFKYKIFENGKEQSRRYYTDKQMDEIFPVRGKNM